MTRYTFLERCLVQVYGQFPTDDAEMTIDLVNSWLPDAIASAAAQNYKESVQIDGIGYVNNSFYTTFSGISITLDDTENLCYKLTLPEIPVGIGRNQGVSTLKFKDSNGLVSLTAIPVSIDEWGYAEGLLVIPNKILFLPEGKVLRMKTTLPLFQYTGVVKMISGGDSNNLDSELNVPPNYLVTITEYIKQQLLFEKTQPKDVAIDGNDQP